MDRTRAFKKKKNTTSSTQNMDLDDLSDEFLDSMAGVDACSPLLDFDLSTNVTLSRNDDLVQLSLDTMDNPIAPSNLAASTALEQVPMAVPYQFTGRVPEDTKNASNIASMDSMHIAVDDLDMFSPYAGDHDAHLNLSAADDFLPNFSDTMLDLNFCDTSTPAPDTIEDSKANRFDVVSMMDLTDENIDTLPFMNTTVDKEVRLHFCSC